MINPEDIKKMLIKETIILHGTDKDNRFCIIVRPRYHNPGLFTIDELIRYGIFIIDQATKQTEL